MRHFDIIKSDKDTIDVTVNGEAFKAIEGETVLSMLIANGFKDICLNDHEKVQGAYCGMGICHACLVTIDSNTKQRSCLAQVQANSVIETQKNLFTEIKGVNNERV